MPMLPDQDVQARVERLVEGYWSLQLQATARATTRLDFRKVYKSFHSAVDSRVERN